MERYILVSSFSIVLKSEITKLDLHKVKSGYYDHIIDIESKTYYDADSNSWKEIDTV